MNNFLTSTQQVLTPERVGIGIVAFLIIVMISSHAVGSKARAKDRKTYAFGHADALMLVGLVAVVALLFYVSADLLHSVAAEVLGIPTSKILACHGTWTATGFAYDLVVTALFVAVALLLVGLDEILAAAFMPRERVKLLVSGTLVSVAIVLALGVAVLLAHILGQPLVTLPAC